MESLFPERNQGKNMVPAGLLLRLLSKFFSREWFALLTEFYKDNEKPKTVGQPKFDLTKVKFGKKQTSISFVNQHRRTLDSVRVKEEISKVANIVRKIRKAQNLVFELDDHQVYYYKDHGNLEALEKLLKNQKWWRIHIKTNPQKKVKKIKKKQDVNKREEEREYERTIIIREEISLPKEKVKEGSERKRNNEEETNTLSEITTKKRKEENNVQKQKQLKKKDSYMEKLFGSDSEISLYASSGLEDNVTNGENNNKEKEDKEKDNIKNISSSSTTSSSRDDSSSDDNSSSDSDNSSDTD